MKSKGITLIALVITIIVLLILAGITINLTIGNQGVITRAQQAATNYKDAEGKEQAELDNFDSEVEDVLEGIDNTEVLPGQISKSTVKNNYTDGTKTATIPKGFTVSGIEDEQHIDTGLVIYDIPKSELDKIDWSSDAGKKSVQEKYNQFVWIPCTVKEYNDANDDIIENSWQSNKQYKDNGDTDYEGTDGNGDGTDWKDNYTTDDKTVIDKVYTSKNALPVDEWIKNDQVKAGTDSIETYGGFYVARYEAGIPSTATGIYAHEAGDAYTEAGRGTKDETSNIRNLSPVSKKGMQAWNFITQPNAKLVSENMYKGTVKSYLIDNRAWNVICNKFNSILGNTDAEKTITNSTKWGNYYDTNTTNYNSINGLWALHTYGDPWTIPTQYKKEAIPTEVPDGRKNNNRIELGTGVCDNFKVYNIYDMAGNMNEWTTSHNAKGGNVYGVFRGGSFDCHGTNDPVVRAGGKFDIERCAADVSFRVVLYI